ncbi:putative skeletal organic matrix protein 7 [Lamellibrachia satsuma]|nr:putative skeletal organic matrix protein 7 [Lamellibrachia satsuma]
MVVNQLKSEYRKSDWLKLTYFICCVRPTIEVPWEHAYGCNTAGVSRTVTHNVLDATVGSSREDGICRILNESPIDDLSYDVTGQFDTRRDNENNDTGAPGLVFNVHDKDNFDFVIYRHHDRDACYQAGHVLKGEMFLYVNLVGRCANGPPPTRTWVWVFINVRGAVATVRVAGSVVARDYRTRHWPRGHVGSMAMRGYGTVMWYKPEVLIAQPYATARVDWFNTSGCSNENIHVVTPTYLALYSKVATGVCRVRRQTGVTADAYDVNVTLNSHLSGMELHRGSQGIVYNVVDDDNYEFFYTSLHDVSSCYHTGYVVAGVMSTQDAATTEGVCPTGPPNGRVWYRLSVSVRRHLALLFLNGQELARVLPHHPPKGDAGLMMMNGFDNIVLIRGFSITQQPLGFTVVTGYESNGCTHTDVLLAFDHMIVDAAGPAGVGTTNYHCRVRVPYEVYGRAYDYKVSLLRYSEDGVVAAMYNVDDEDNFDFIAFRLNAAPDDCFTTGHVTATTVLYTAALSGPCQPATPGNQTWFDVAVRVRAHVAYMYMNGRYLGLVRTHLSTRGKGGVMCSKGTANKMFFKNPSLQTKSLDYASAFTARRCDNDVINSTIYFNLTPDPVGTGLCNAVARQTVTARAYRVQVQLENKAGPSGSSDDGGTGIIYNVKDANNFDFVLITFANTTHCFRTGYLETGRMRFDDGTSGSCNGLGLTGATPFTSEIVVRDHLDTTVSINGRQEAQIQPHHPTKGTAGVLALNGFDNEVFFQNFILEKQNMPFATGIQTTDCGIQGAVETPTPGVLELRALGGAFPGDGHCRAVLTPIVNVRSYRASIILQNIRGDGQEDFGNIGLMYNVHDADNFDFILLRIRPGTGLLDRCYVTGSYVYGRATWQSSQTGPCAARLRGQTDINVLVAANIYGRPRVYIDGTLVARPTPSHTSQSRVGVIVTNGYRNIMHFQLPDVIETLSGTCESDPCENQGNCTEHSNGYSCTCPPGYGGDQCAHITDHCVALAPCQNGATCRAQGGQYICDCTPGFGGHHCAVALAACYSVPCANGGTCVAVNKGYKCTCAAGFAGDTCTTDVDECASNPCLGGSTCVNRTNGYMCDCTVGLGGVHCEMDIDECASSPCVAGSSCQNLTGRFLCVCPIGRNGTLCEIDINACHSHPCQNNGFCSDLPGGFRCNCQVDFNGIYCEHDTRDHCRSAPCQNGGTCQLEWMGFNCSCPSSHDGALCETRIIGCRTQPCANNGTCIAKPFGYDCQCATGFVGPTCQLNVDGCLSLPCENNGLCSTAGNGAFVCHCTPGFAGPTCAVVYVACASSPCENGGRCEGDGNANFVCDCGQKFAGAQCELTAVSCVQSPCRRPATSCYSLGRDFRCVCAPGYTGVVCEETDPDPDDVGLVNECLSDPCQHRGSCGDLVGHFVCVCVKGTTGVKLRDECRVTVQGQRNGEPAKQYCICSPFYNGSQCQEARDPCENNPCRPDVCVVDTFNLRSGYRCTPGHDTSTDTVDVFGVKVKWLLLLIIASCILLALLLLCILAFVFRNTSSSEKGRPKPTEQMAEPEESVQSKDVDPGSPSPQESAHTTPPPSLTSDQPNIHFWYKGTE